MTEQIFKDVLTASTWTKVWDCGVSGDKDVVAINYANNGLVTTHGYAITEDDSNPVAADYIVPPTTPLPSHSPLPYIGVETLRNSQCFWVISGNSNTTVRVEGRDVSIK